MQKTIMGLLVGTVLLSGCTPFFSESPSATHFPSEKQRKMQAASHWQLIARDTAEQLIDTLSEKHPLYVSRPARQSPFEKAFTQQLIASLVAAGYPVMTNPDEDVLVVEVSAEPVHFSPHRRKFEAVGERTMLAGGLWALYHVYEHVSPAAAAATAVVAYDAMEWLRSEYASGPTPKTELIVTTSVFSDERYYAQSTNAYYTTESDWGLYAQGPVTIPVTGGY